MSIDLPDDEDDDDVQQDGLLPPELQAEYERLLAAHDAAQSQSTSRQRLTPDLEALETRIGGIAAQRRLLGDAVPPYMFDRFEALATVRGGMGLVRRGCSTRAVRRRRSRSGGHTSRLGFCQRWSSCWGSRWR